MKSGKMLKSLIPKTKHLPEEPIATGTSTEEQLRPSVHHDLPRTVAQTDTLHAHTDEADMDEPIASSPRTSKSKKEKLVNMWKRGLKGKEKGNEADNRAQLLDEHQNDKMSPRLRSENSIKAAYGHKPSGNTSSIAALSRDKLIERKEKLQAINKYTEELQDGAGNFASVAEELAKKMENRKWYQL